VNIGGRQFRRERGGNVIDTAYSATEIREAVTRQLSHGPYAVSNLYGDGKAGIRIADLLATVPLSYDKQLTY
jgi:hypothetical protein